MTDASDPVGPLAGVKVLDLSRILAGPTATQLLGDLGATVLKVENPRSGGDDTRQWGPPYVKDGAEETDLSAYFMSANRNKLSVAIDLSSPEGQEQIRRLAGLADIVIENFKPGGLAKYGLDHATLLAAHPRLVYCSISGFGQTGPNRDKPGYDLMAQGYGGIMSLTGDPDGLPMKVGVGIADVMCGMYATVGILAALRHAEATGEGQHIDLALVDSQIAWTINEGVNTRLSGKAPIRRGNDHPNIVPYGVYETADGHVIVAVGNDGQFARFVALFGLAELAEDSRFATNPARLANRDALAAHLIPALRAVPTDEVIARMEAAKVPVGPVKTLPQVFETDQVAARGMTLDMTAQGKTGELTLPLLGNPLKLSRTPVTYRRPPPSFGADTDRLEQDDPFAD
ncbi:CaiB/BaiF CoA transferase family protein [Jannaschia seohaensis]|uniref:Crotonobetainyl-CoA:carnitine CoA-transferase CaiB n=1 Tax=Jannaschia seohaensis TaxID=475081 RepID=A0A2Y9B1C8_9RHOB|nr:CoA transferase [Jannaschia seohaensis]PWJ13791.1 crotonobetainyl-CoA:carnitine CoA-transferase CaiB-like acyl-CoA transferase [Jannaschia seohaensis]SSA50304.1 Crotonobetainyl-CoA:carnitine CoA-transferase CaiB [Jannaschia seohaensis]